MRRPVLVVLTVLAAACSPPEPLAGIDLPPASLPDQYETALWAISFSHDFEPGFWEEGTHTYNLNLTCPAALDAPLETRDLSFIANPRTQVLDGRAYLRLVGLADSPTGPRNLVSISTEQPTTAILTIIGVPEDAAHDATDCTGEVQFDRFGKASLLPGQPFRV
jgi:hypothetical protein